jgi:sulfur-oxidizing protein SoxX
MPKPGSRRSPPKCSANALATALVLASAAAAQDVRTVAIVDDSMATSLTGAPGDPGRGRAIVADRQKGLCLLCHSGPFPEQRFQGDLAPNLRGVGSRLTEGQLRLRIVDSRKVNPATIMPPYHSTEGLTRVGRNWQGKPVLAAAEVEDVVAYLTTLKEGP